MAERPKPQPADDAEQTWKPTPEAKQQATRLRIIAAVLWVVAIAGEAVAIFWLLGQREGTEIVRGDDGTLTESSGQLAQWAFITLIVAIVVIGILSVVGSLLWKKANRLDPASKKDAVRFFVQNQLGAIVAIIAFLPLVILIFTNKDMSKGQKTTAGIVGVVVALAAVVLGADFSPPSVEQYTADQSAVIQIVGEDRVYWAPSSKVYHVCESVSDLSGSDVQAGTTAEAIEALAKNTSTPRLTLKLESELNACDRPVPENIDEIVAALGEIQDGVEGVVLPAPTWTAGTDVPAIDELITSSAD